MGYRAFVVVGCFVGVVALLTGASHAQTNYSAGNFSVTNGYVRGFGITSTSQPTALRWQGNDPYNSANGLGETDLIARVSGYTPGPVQNSSLIQGGLGVASAPQVLPGRRDVRLWKSFTSSFSSIFFAEWSIIPSLEGAPYNRADTFAFDLRNADNSQSLLALQFTPGIALQPASYTLQSIAAGSGTNSIVDLAYQALFQVSVSLSGSNWSLSLTQINSTNRAVLASYTNLASGTLASGTTASEFATIGVNWDLASGNNLEPGSNYILANQFTVVPEPSTWALLVTAGITLGALTLRRRKA
jgi:hypothetical protein